MDVSAEDMWLAGGGGEGIATQEQPARDLCACGRAGGRDLGRSVGGGGGAGERRG